MTDRQVPTSLFQDRPVFPPSELTNLIASILSDDKRDRVFAINTVFFTHTHTEREREREREGERSVTIHSTSDAAALRRKIQYSRSTMKCQSNVCVLTHCETDLLLLMAVWRIKTFIVRHSSWKASQVYNTGRRHQQAAARHRRMCFTALRYCLFGCMAAMSTVLRETELLWQKVVNCVNGWHYLCSALSVARSSANKCRRLFSLWWMQRPGKKHRLRW